MQQVPGVENEKEQSYHDIVCSVAWSQNSRMYGSLENARFNMKPKNTGRNCPQTTREASADAGMAPQSAAQQLSRLKPAEINSKSEKMLEAPSLASFHAGHGHVPPGGGRERDRGERKREGGTLSNTHTQMCVRVYVCVCV